MRIIEFVPILLTENADVFSIRLSGNPSSEFEKFYICFKDTEDAFLHNDLDRFLATIQTIGLKGALENETRPEGSIRVALKPLRPTRRTPPFPSRSLFLRL